MKYKTFKLGYESDQLVLDYYLKLEVDFIINWKMQEKYANQVCNSLMSLYKINACA